MIGLNYNEFYDKLFYGADIEILFKSWYYLINCGWDKTSNPEQHIIDVVKSDQSYYEQKNEPKIWEDVFSSCMEDGNKNIETFLKAKIFDNKDFYEVENDRR